MTWANIEGVTMSQIYVELTATKKGLRNVHQSGVVAKHVVACAV